MTENLIEEPKLTKTEKGLVEKKEFVPRRPDYKGTLDAVAWEIRNSDGKIVGFKVKIGTLTFKLMRSFL